MHPSLLLYSFVVFSVIESLYQRYYAKTHPNFIHTGMLFGHVFFFWPSAIIYTAINGKPLRIGEMFARDWPLLLIIGLCAGIMYSFALVVARKVEASTQQIVRTIGPISLLFMAGLFLGERLTTLQYVGAAVLITTTLIYASHKTFKHINNYLLLAFVTQIIFSFTLVTEKYLLTKYGLATYLPVGWGMEVLFLAVFTFSLAKQELVRNTLTRRTLRDMLFFGITLAPASMLYITSVNSWSNVSYVNAVSVSQYIITAFAAIYILHERELFARKLIAVLAAAIGLYLLG